MLRNYINGEFREAADGRTLDVTDPCTGEVYETSALSGAADVDAAMEAAAAAFPAWRDATPAARQKVLCPLSAAPCAASRVHRRRSLPPWLAHRSIARP